MSNTKRLSLMGLLLALAMVFQLMGRSYPDLSRPLVGPLINLLIILGMYYGGLRYGMMLAGLTPLTALIIGQLNPALAAFVPLIMLSNIVFGLTFYILRQHFSGRILGVILGSGLKYLLLVLAVRYLAPVMGFAPPLLTNMARAFGTVQLISALIGGGLAIGLIELLARRVRP